MVVVEVAGRRRRVTARRARNGWVVTIDGRTLSVHLEASKGRSSLLLREDPAPVTAQAEPPAAPYYSYEIAVDRRGRGEYTIHVNGQAVVARIADPRTLFGRRGHESSPANGPARITSPMPGRVVKVLVKPGDTPAAGQPLVVVEAMKMENELRAPRAGTVSEIRVGEGTSIEANTVLVILE